MEFKGLATKKTKDGKDLLLVGFDDEEQSKDWVPKWKDLRKIVRFAVLTEFANAGGEANEELELFHRRYMYLLKKRLGVRWKTLK